MWCENCDAVTVAGSTTIRITNHGTEVIRQRCETCKLITEVEYYEGPTVRIINDEGKKENGKKISKSKRKRSRAR